MSGLKISVDQIKELMDKMAQTNLGEFSIEAENFKLKLEAKKEKIQVVTSSEEKSFVKTKSVENSYDSQVEKTQETTTVAGNVVTSPIVGTFYASPSPEKPKFVEVGQKVKKGDVLFIIESMKLMNEIQSEFDGEVLEILANDAQAVEFGQEIMIIG